MEVQCAWCGKKLRVKPPYEDKGITHSICEDCLRKYFGKEVMPIKEGRQIEEKID